MHAGGNSRRVIRVRTPLCIRLDHDAHRQAAGCPHNPILTKDEIPYPVETVHNAGVAKYESEYIMLFRSHLRTGRSIIGLTRRLGSTPFIQIK